MTMTKNCEICGKLTTATKHNYCTECGSKPHKKCHICHELCWGKTCFRCLSKNKGTTVSARICQKKRLKRKKEEKKENGRECNQAEDST